MVATRVEPLELLLRTTEVKGIDGALLHRHDGASLKNAWTARPIRALISAVPDGSFQGVVFEHPREALQEARGERG